MRRLFLCGAALLALSCKSRTQPAPAPGAAAFDAGAAAAGAPDLPPDEEVKPVYPPLAGAASPLAQKLCTALQDLPHARRAACCSAQKGLVFTDLCTQTLSSALQGGALSLDPARVDACAAAQARAYDGCGWVGQWSVPLPAECANLFQGLRKSGAPCRSSLECADGLRCAGVGPTQAGRCGPPRGDGEGCLGSVDALAVYTQQDLEQHHRECAGYCGHRRCEPVLARGASCVMSRACAAGLHCDGDHCVSGAEAREGERCVGDSCAAGLRCVADVCRTPRPEGAACKDDRECSGGCIPATHTCGPRCDVR